MFSGPFHRKFFEHLLVSRNGLSVNQGIIKSHYELLLSRHTALVCDVIS